MSFFDSRLFQGQKILVTGGGSGIGLRIAADLLKCGAEQVVLLGRGQDKLEKARLTLEGESGGRVQCVSCNIRNESEVQSAVLRISEISGSVDVLINNAGGQFPSSTEAISQKGWHAVIETNLTGTFLITKACFQSFFKESGGAIVNMLMNMRSGMPLMPHSAAARAGVENLTKTWAVEWAHHGVRVNAVAPGIIESSGLETYAPEFRAKLEKTKLNNYAARFGTEGEVSSAVLFLASRAASYISGVTLAVDAAESLYSPLLPPREHNRLPPGE